MNIELSTAGMELDYAVESTAGTRPTTGFVKISGVKSLPSIGGEPEAIEVTDLSDTTYRRYIQGLIDTGGNIGIRVNDYQSFRDDWDDVLSDYAALTGGKKMWFEIVVPGLTDSFYFSGIPSKLGFDGAEVNSPLENVAYITINEVLGWDTAST